MNAWEKAAKRIGGSTSRVASCPITRSQPTTMLAETFERLCCRHRQDVPSYCADVCHGKILPGNLTLVARRDIEKTFQPTSKESIMTKREQGTCEICGGKKIVERVAGIEACSVCSFLARAVKNGPELVIAEMQRQHGEKYFPTASAGQKEGEPVRMAADEMIERIIFNYSLEPGSNVEFFVGNLTREVGEFKRQAHAAEQTLENLRGLLECSEDESIVEAVVKLERERKKATDIWFETLQILEANVACAAESLPMVARERMAERQENISRRYAANIPLKILDLLGKSPDADPVFELGLVMDEYYTMKAIPQAEAVLESTAPGPYASLRRVLDLAWQQAANGKGRERHAKDGEPFEQQKICEIARRVGLGFPIGQAVKKAEESVGLGIGAGIRENLGAINYLAAAVIVMEEAAAGSASLHVPV